MPPRLTAFYARLTREDAASASIENQTAGFEDLRARHGWTARHFVESGRRASGEWTPAKRPALYQLLEAVERGEVERVVVRHLDRLGRGPVLLQVLETLGGSGVDLWDFNGTVEYRTAAGELGTGVQALVGRFEVRRTGERIRAARRGHWQRGVHVGPCPFGYTSQSRVKRELIGQGVDEVEAQVQAQVRVPVAPGLLVDEVEAQVVREVFALYLEGLGARAIANRLAARGLTKRGNRWTAQAVHKLLRDPKVAGLAHFDEAAYQGHQRRSIRPKHKQALHPAAHPALIERATWDRAQLLLDSRGRQVAGAGLTFADADGARARRSRLYPLTGVLYCANGHPMKGTSSGTARNLAGDGWAYYACSSRAHRGTAAAGGCDAPRIHADRAERLAVTGLAGILADPEAVRRGHDAARRLLLAEVPVNRSEEERIGREIRDLEGRREGVLAAFRNPALTTEAQAIALGEVQRLNTRIATLTTARQEAALKAQPVAVSDIRLEEVQVLFAGLAAGLEGQPQALRELFELVRRHHQLRVVALAPARVSVSFTLHWRGRGHALALPLDAVAEEPMVTREEWAAREQGLHLCACGCGQAIRITPEMMAPTRGIPRFVQGHHEMRATAEVHALEAEGLVTLTRAAELLGMGTSTLSRAVKRGVVSPARSGWRGMMAFRRLDLPAMREALIAGGHRFADGPVVTTPEMAAALGVRPRVLADLAEHLAGHLAAQGITVQRDSNGRWLWPRAEVEAIRATLQRTVRRLRG